MLLTICGGIFSIGGLYVSFNTMKMDVEKNAVKLERIDDDISKLDIEEIKGLEKRLSKVEYILSGIDKQLDRIEKNIESSP